MDLSEDSEGGKDNWGSVSDTDLSINSLRGFVFHHNDENSDGEAPLQPLAARAVRTVQLARQSAVDSLQRPLAARTSVAPNPVRRGTIYQDSREEDSDDDAASPLEIPVISSSLPSSRPPSRQSIRSSSSSPTPIVPSKKKSPSSLSPSPTLPVHASSHTTCLAEPARSSPVPNDAAALPKSHVVVSSVETAIKSAKSAIVKSRALLDGTLLTPSNVSRSSHSKSKLSSSSHPSPSGDAAILSPGRLPLSPSDNVPRSPLLPLAASPAALHPELLRLGENFAKEMERHRQAIEELAHVVDEEADDDSDDENGEDENCVDDDEEEEEGDDEGSSNSDARSGYVDASSARVSFARAAKDDPGKDTHLYPQVDRQLATVGVTRPRRETAPTAPLAISPENKRDGNTGVDIMPVLRYSVAVSTPPSARRPSVEPHGSSSENFSRSPSVSSPGGGAESSQALIEEHRLFVKAVFQLLAERDGRSALSDGAGSCFQAGNVDGAREGQGSIAPGVIKCGSLKKASSATLRAVTAWKTKYVKITRGLFSYYDDVIPVQSSAGTGGGSKGEAGKHIILRAGGDGGQHNVSSPSNHPTNDLDGEGGGAQSQAVTCRAVALNSVNPLHSGGFCFEIVSGGTSRLWMAISREERASWIRAVHSATIGSSTTRSTLQYEDEYEKGGVPTRDPLRNDMLRYQQVQNALKSASGRDDYVQGLRSGLKMNEGKGDDFPMRVPVHWIRQQFEDAATQKAKASGGFVATALGQHQGVSKSPSAFLEASQSAGITQLWKDMQRDSVSLNGEVYNGGELGPEAIVGALTRSIIECDGGVPLLGSLRRRGLTELQAVTFARDILLACNRTRSGGDTYFCVDMLTRRPDLVVLCPHSSFVSPLEITVRKESPTKPDQEFSGMNPHYRQEKSGWLFKRCNSRKAWKRRFFVLSEGILSYYERAEPRPVCLRGQVVLVGATLETEKVLKESEVESFNDGRAQQNDESKDVIVLHLKCREKELQFRFYDEVERAAWEAALTSEISAFDDVPSTEDAHFRGGNSDDESDREVVTPAGKKTPPGKTRVLLDMKRQKSLKDMFTPTRNLIQNNVKRVSGMLGNSSNNCAHATSGAGATESSPELDSLAGGRKSPDIVNVDHDTEAVNHEMGDDRVNDCLGIEVVVQANAVYKICTIDPEGEDDDTWAVLLAVFEQRFLLSRGPGGVFSIVRGNETVSLQFFNDSIEL